MNPTPTFIEEANIPAALEQAAHPSKVQIRDILQKALEKKGLDLPEVAALLNADTPECAEALFAAAGRVKQDIYGKRLVLFAPLYLANYCANNCLYCGFRRDNTRMVRRVLSMDEIRREVEVLERLGHKRILLLTGEDEKTSSLDYLVEAIRTAYAVKTPDGKGEIRRINVEVAPQTVEGFRRLKQAQIGTYVLFQETYHPPTYAVMHPDGPKSDYRWRLYAQHRAQEASLDDVGIGALFGLYDYRFEVLGLLAHARDMDRSFGVGPHTISIPRIESASHAPAALQVPAPVTDAQFKRLTAILRLAVPYTGIILSTRENAAMRHELVTLGVSQVSAGSRTNPGGYGGACDTDDSQFALGDNRTMDEVIRSLCEQGYLPSLCTACYRQGRTGSHFMELAKPGLIHEYCLPNALVTFKEYLMDYASPETKAIGEQVILRQVDDIRSPGMRQDTEARLRSVEAGQRDLYW